MDPWTGQPKRPSFKPSKNKLIVLLKKYRIYFNLNRVLKRFNFPNLGNQSSFSAGKFILHSILNLFIGWLLLGFFVVKPDMEAVVTRWGCYQKTVYPGIHWHKRFVEKVFKLHINQSKNHTKTISSLTVDGKLVSITISIQYKIHDSRNFLFGIKKPIDYLDNLILATVHTQLKQYTLGELLTNTPAKIIQQSIQKVLQARLAEQPTGLQAEEAFLPVIHPPVELKKDFKASEQAQSEAKQLINQAKLHAEKIQQSTSLKIQQLYQKANTQKYKTIVQSEADIHEFLALLPSYENNPQLTIQRLYFEKVESILRKNPKALVINPGQVNNKQYSVQLSLDQLLSQLPQNSKSKEKPTETRRSVKPPSNTNLHSPNYFSNSS